MIFKTPTYIHNFILLLTLLIAYGLTNPLHAQCTAPPAIRLCIGGNGAATDGVIINSGQSFWNSATATLPMVNLNAGGTLRVCGNLTLSTLNFNGGNILIEAGGSLTINGGGPLNMNGNLLFPTGVL